MTNPCGNAMELANKVSAIKSASDDLRHRHQWQQEAQTLSQRAVIIERERTTVLNRVRQCPDCPLPTSDVNALRKEEMQLVQFLKRCSSDLSRFKRLLHGGAGSKTRQQYLETVGQLAHRLEHSILEFKAKNVEVMESLLAEEKLCTRQLKVFEEAFEKWEEARALPPTPAPACRYSSPTAWQQTAKGRSSTSTLPKEVQAMHRFLADCGGTTGGWAQEDHATFLRLKCQIKTEEQLIAKVVMEVPNQTEETVTQHMQWCDRYLALEAAQRAAVARWKEAREAEQRQALEAEQHRVKEQTVHEQEAQQRRREKEALEAKKATVQEWRRKQQELKKELEEEARMKEQRVAEAQAKRQAKELAAKREQVQKFREAREERQATEQAQRRALTPRPRAVSTEELQERHVQNLQLVKTRLQQMDRKDWKVAQMNLHDRLNRYVAAHQPLVERDPNRVLSPTVVVKQREQCTKYGVEDQPLAAADSALMRGIKPIAPVPTRRTGRSMVTWRQAS